jgi:predicted membrane protein (TIGR00267 family)
MPKNISEIIPVRYTVLGTIDGVVACLAIVLGVFSASVDVKLIIAAGLSGGFGLGISNGIGGLMAEATVESKRMREIEDAMIMKKGAMRGTIVHKRIKRKLMYDTMTHGGCSFLGAMIPIVPFFFFGINNAMIVSITVSFITLFLLGIYMGVMTRETLMVAGLKMLFIGILVAAVVRLFGGLH